MVIRVDKLLHQSGTTKLLSFTQTNNKSDKKFPTIFVFENFLQYKFQYIPINQIIIF